MVTYSVGMRCWYSDNVSARWNRSKTESHEEIIFVWDGLIQGHIAPRRKS